MQFAQKFCKFRSYRSKRSYHSLRLLEVIANSFLCWIFSCKAYGFNFSNFWTCESWVKSFYFPNWGIIFLQLGKWFLHLFESQCIVMTSQIGKSSMENCPSCRIIPSKWGLDNEFGSTYVHSENKEIHRNDRFVHGFWCLWEYKWLIISLLEKKLSCLLFQFQLFQLIFWGLRFFHFVNFLLYIIIIYIL